MWFIEIFIQTFSILVIRFKPNNKAITQIVPSPMKSSFAWSVVFLFQYPSSVITISTTERDKL